MNNIVKPVACKIREVRRESLHEYTFRVETDIRPSHGQFLQLSIPKVGEAPISVSSFGDGWMDFTIRSVGKVTDEIFEKQPGDILFLRGAYGKGWPVEQFQGKHMVVITGGTGLAPVKSMLNMFWEQEDFVKSVHLISGFKNEDGIISNMTWTVGRRSLPPSMPWIQTARMAGRRVLSQSSCHGYLLRILEKTTASWWLDRRL